MRLRRRYGHALSVAAKQAQRKFPKGQRVLYAKAGPHYGQHATVEYVRPDALLVLHFDGDPPGMILVAYPTDVQRVGT